jgi:hypothetical protein
MERGLASAGVGAFNVTAGGAFVEMAGSPRRLGFMRGAVTVPDDFDTMDQEEIEKLFYGDE